MNTHELPPKSYYIKYSILSFLGLFLLSFLVLLFVEIEVRQSRVQSFQRDEIRVVQLEVDFLEREFDSVLGDIHYLHHAFKDDLVPHQNLNAVADNWAIFSLDKRIYDQIRYLDNKGNEIIRINYDDTGSQIVPPSQLQNKADRYYFKEAMLLPEDTVYISQLDLNIEDGYIEEPHKPMIRFATNIRDENGIVQGVIILNYLAEHTLNGFRILGENNIGNMYLINEDGYSLSSDTPEADWNFMFDEKMDASFKSDYEKAWRLLQEYSQVSTENGLFTINHVDVRSSFSNVDTLDEVSTDESWYVVSHTPRTLENRSLFNDNMIQILTDVIVQDAFYFILIFIGSALIGVIVYINRKAYYKVKYFSEFDTLTRSYNRRAGMQKLEDMFPNDDRRFFQVTLCFIDINGLKEVNDTLGHKSGDELIVTVSDTIKSTIREYDFLIRLGGDEFLIVFSSIPPESAEKVWQRIVGSFDKINTSDTRNYNISASHGMVSYTNREKNHIDMLISQADKYMYAEKKIIKKDLKVIKEDSSSQVNP